MVRLPSLKQLSDRLHPSPSPLGLSTSQPTAAAESTDKPSTPPKLKVSINTSASSRTSTTSPFSSPSTRLKLPASAMTRSHSSGTVTTPAASEETPRTSLFTNSDPFSMVTPKEKESTMGAGTSMSRSSSKEGYVKGYKDVPSLAAIRARVNVSRGMSISEHPQETTKTRVEGPKKEEAKPVEGLRVNISPPETASTASEGEIRRKKEHPLQHAW